MYPSGGTPVLAAAPLNWSSFGAEGNCFLRSQPWSVIQCTFWMQKNVAAVAMQNAAFGPRPCWAAQRLSQVVDLGVGGGGVGHEPVHDPASVTYRLRSPSSVHGDQSPVGAAAN